MLRRSSILSLFSVLIALMLSIAGACTSRGAKGDSESQDEKRFPDTLRVGTLYSPMSYFLYREMPMGYDYDLVMKLAADKGFEVDLQVAPSLNRLLEMLDSGLVDLAAYEIPITGEYKSRVLACGTERITSQVLVQPSKGKNERISDVTELIGKDVYVEADSKYHYRMLNLDEELGGGINIHPIARDTLISEDLIEMVSTGEIPLTVVDGDIAMLNKTYYRNLDISLEVSFPQRSSWGVAPGNEWLADSISEWFEGESPRNTQAALLRRYFEMGKIEESSGRYYPNLNSGKISPYDGLFKKYSNPIGWDWRLMASQGYAESQFDSTVVSWAGAKGIMQIMPGSARAYGVSEADMTKNEVSVSTAAKIIKTLDDRLATKVEDPEERKKFVVAAYNSGLAHILDAIALAEKYGYDPKIWKGNVAEALLLKSKPEYYNDEVCRYGYFRGRQTYEYVQKVFSFYDRAKKKIKL